MQQYEHVYTQRSYLKNNLLWLKAFYYFNNLTPSSEICIISLTRKNSGDFIYLDYILQWPLQGIQKEYYWTHLKHKKWEVKKGVNTVPSFHELFSRSSKIEGKCFSIEYSSSKKRIFIRLIKYTFGKHLQKWQIPKKHHVKKELKIIE